MHQWSMQLSEEHIILLHKPHTCKKTHSGVCKQMQASFHMNLWRSKLVTFKEHVINAADKWCGEIKGCTHHGSGERINPITSKVWISQRSCSSLCTQSPLQDRHLEDKDSGVDEIGPYWFKSMNRGVCPLQLRKHIEMGELHFVTSC